MKKQIKDTKEVITAKARKPITKPVANKEDNKLRKPGLLKGKIWISDDFNDEDEEINKLFYGE